MVEVLRAQDTNLLLIKGLGNKLLDNAAEEVDQQLSNKVKNNRLTVTLVSLSSVQSVLIQSVTIQTGTESFLLKALILCSKKNEQRIVLV